MIKKAEISKTGTRGTRLKFLRTRALGLTHDEFAKLVGLGASTIRHAEKSHITDLSEKNAKKIVSALVDLNINLTLSWMLNGVGTAPVAYNPPGSEQIIQGQTSQEIQYYRHTHPNSITMTLDNNKLSPFFLRGDVVGGIKASSNFVQKNKTHIFIIVTKDNNKSINRIGDINPLTRSAYCFKSLLISSDAELITLNYQDIYVVSRLWRDINTDYTHTEQQAL